MATKPVERLFVIVGAGASVDCATDGWRKRVGDHLTPPLVKDLFSPKYAPILDKYPIAQMVAADLEGLDPDALILEQHIRERYRDSTHPLDRQKFLSIAPYLQDLLFQVGRSYARSPDNHDRLISALLRFPEVVFLSLNYDTLLDDRLAITSPILRIDGYIAERQPRWSLIKLHGSVNWGRAIMGDDDFSFALPRHEPSLSAAITLRGGASPAAVREDSQRTLGHPWQFYPAVSVPVGQADEIVCPPEHVAFLKERLGTAFDGVDLLVIGYSANDQEVINVLREVGRPIRSLAVVNRSLMDAKEVAEKLRDEMPTLGVPHAYVFDGDYSGFATEGELERYIAWLRSRPSRAAIVG